MLQPQVLARVPLASDSGTGLQLVASMVAAQARPLGTAVVEALGSYRGTSALVHADTVGKLTTAPSRAERA